MICVSTLPIKVHISLFNFKAAYYTSEKFGRECEIGGLTIANGITKFNLWQNNFLFVNDGPV
jgi:hypothetical protein